MELLLNSGEITDVSSELRTEADKLKASAEKLTILAYQLRDKIKEKEIYADVEQIAEDLRSIHDVLQSIKQIRLEYETGRKRDAIQKLVESVLSAAMMSNKMSEIRVKGYKFYVDAKVVPGIPRADTEEFEELVERLTRERPEALKMKILYEEVVEWAKEYLERGENPPVKVYLRPTIKVRRINDE